MTNIIEIRVQATDATATGLDSAKTSAKEAGAQAGESFSAAFDESSSSISAAFQSSMDEVMVRWEETASSFGPMLANYGPEIYAAGEELGGEFGIAFSASAEASLASINLESKLAASTGSGGLGSGFAPMQGIDLVEQNIGTMGQSFDKASTSASSMEGVVAKAGVSAEKSAGSFGGMASMLGGPVMYAAFGLMTVIPLLSGAFDTASFSASNYTSAVSKDTNFAGENTAATIQQTLAKTNLNSISQELGISQATLIEYASGDANAQQQVVQAYTAKEDALNKASNAEGVHSKAQADNGNAADKESNSLNNNKRALDAVTTAVQQAILQDKSNSDALLQADMNYKILGATLDGMYSKMQLNAQQAAITSVANLNLGTSQMGLNTQLIQGEQAYTESAQEASSYGSVLTSLNGDIAGLLGSEAAFTTSLNTLTTSIKTNGDSLDVNTTKGAANVQAVIAIANAADKAAVAVYQNEVNTKGSTLAYDDANKKLEQEKTAFENAAISAGMSKDAVVKLADELFKLPAQKDIPITANIQPAINGLAEVLNRIDSSSGTVTIYENTSGQVFSSGGGSKAQATGGPSVSYAAVGGSRSGTTIMNEQGPEAVNLPNGSMVVPHANTESLMSQMIGAFGGGGKFQMEWVGTNGGDKLMEWIRENIRTRYGSDPQSVQKALGYTY